MFIVTYVAHTHTHTVLSALPLPWPLSTLQCLMTHFTTTAVCPDNQQPVFNLSNLSVIELFQLCCKVSAKDLPGTLQ